MQNYWQTSNSLRFALLSIRQKSLKTAYSWVYWYAIPFWYYFCHCYWWQMTYWPAGTKYEQRIKCILALSLPQQNWFLKFITSYLDMISTVSSSPTQRKEKRERGKKERRSKIEKGEFYQIFHSQHKIHPFALINLPTPEHPRPQSLRMISLKFQDKAKPINLQIKGYWWKRGNKKTFSVLKMES